MAANPLSVLTSPSGAQGGGTGVPKASGVNVEVPIDISGKSAASSSLNSSGSRYDLGGGSTGSFSVGGGGQFNLLIIGGLALAALIFLKKR